MTDLSTTYLGLQLANPLVPSASPLGAYMDNLRRMEDAGAAAVVLPSLFEEQLAQESAELDFLLSHGTYGGTEATSFDQGQFRFSPDAYLKHVRRAKAALGIPVIGSLNGVSAGGWIDYALQVERAGADALELNMYYLPTDPYLESVTIEQEYVDVVTEVVRQLHIPVAVKLSPYFTNVALMARKLDQAGAAGLVLFNRFVQPDIDLELVQLENRAALTTDVDPHALRLPLRWIGVLYGRVRANLAASGGVHAARDVAKLLMVGADVTMMTSALMCRGVEHLSIVRDTLRDWMDEHNYPSVRQLRGCLSQRAAALPASYQRAHYVRAVAAARAGGGLQS